MQGFFPAFIGDLMERTVSEPATAAPGHVVKSVKPSKGVQRQINGPVGRLRSDGIRCRDLAGFPQSILDFPAVFLRSSDRDYACPGANTSRRRTTSNPRSAANYDDDFSCQFDAIDNF